VRNDRCTVRVDTVHFFASVETLGQQTPWSSAASANAISTSFSVGMRACRQAQFIATMLNGGATVPLVSSAGRDVCVRCRIAAYRQH
jgi:hypothetical protein